MISAIRLKNFKCFRDLDLQVRPLTVLSGLNASGKSTILQSLLLLRQSWVTFPSSPPLTRLQLNGDLVSVGTARDALYQEADDRAIGFEVIFDGPLILHRYFEYDREVDVLSVRGEPFAHEDDSSREGLFLRDRFQYLSAERIGPRTSFEMSEVAVKVWRQLGSRGEYTAHFLSVYQDEPIPIHALSHPQAPSSGLRQQVEAWLDFICPGTRLTLTDHPGMDVVQLQYQFEVGEQVTDLLRPTNVGFGLTYTLPVIVAALSAHPGSLLLIENPEAHLHPAGQARMGELLALAASQGVQVIVETHSDHILNGVRVAVHDGAIQPDHVALHFFERRAETDRVEHGVVSPSIDRNGRLDRRPRGFFDEWDLSLRKLLMPATKKTSE